MCRPISPSRHPSCSLPRQSTLEAFPLLQQYLGRNRKKKTLDYIKACRIAQPEVLVKRPHHASSRGLRFCQKSNRERHRGLTTAVLTRVSYRFAEGCARMNTMFRGWGEGGMSLLWKEVLVMLQLVFKHFYRFLLPSHRIPAGDRVPSPATADTRMWFVTPRAPELGRTRPLPAVAPAKLKLQLRRPGTQGCWASENKPLPALGNRRPESSCSPDPVLQDSTIL